MAVAHTTTCQNYCSLHRKKCKETGVFFMKGTKFQLQVWNYLKKIPKGSVKTYKQVAIAINKPKSARAVANACAKNPYAPNIPCVIGLLGLMEALEVILEEVELMKN